MLCIESKENTTHKCSLILFNIIALLLFTWHGGRSCVCVISISYGFRSGDSIESTVEEAVDYINVCWIPGLCSKPHRTDGREKRLSEKVILAREPN